MRENKRYVRVLDHSENEVKIFDETNQKSIFNIFFNELDSAIGLNGALEDTVDLLNYFYEENQIIKDENEKLKQQFNYIQNSISEHIKHQKTELGQKALQEIIEDYNEWLLGHKRL